MGNDDTAPAMAEDVEVEGAVQKLKKELKTNLKRKKKK